MWCRIGITKQPNTRIYFVIEVYTRVKVSTSLFVYLSICPAIVRIFLEEPFLTQYDQICNLSLLHYSK